MRHQTFPKQIWYQALQSSNIYNSSVNKKAAALSLPRMSTARLPRVCPIDLGYNLSTIMRWVRMGSVIVDSTCTTHDQTFLL